MSDDLRLAERIHALERAHIDSLQGQIVALNAALSVIFSLLGQGRTTKEDVAAALQDLIDEREKQPLSEAGRLVYEELLRDFLEDLTDPPLPAEE
ncbi:MAG: hypothetical protein OXC18_14765 [Desulfurellaceae bacterium]|nr:hypothetical protein [Desulfurellaceae bacterium]